MQTAETVWVTTMGGTYVVTPSVDARTAAEASVVVTEHRFPAWLRHYERHGRFNVGLLVFRNDRLVAANRRGLSLVGRSWEALDDTALGELVAAEEIQWCGRCRECRAKCGECGKTPSERRCRPCCRAAARWCSWWLPAWRCPRSRP